MSSQAEKIAYCSHNGNYYCDPKKLQLGYLAASKIIRRAVKSADNPCSGPARYAPRSSVESTSFLAVIQNTRIGDKNLVAGSACLDYYRFGGDSLQGRYHHLKVVFTAPTHS